MKHTYLSAIIALLLALQACQSPPAANTPAHPQPEASTVEDPFKTLNFSAINTNTEDTQPSVKWYWAQAPDGKHTRLIFKASIEDGWDTYSEQMADGGPQPTQITFESGNVKELHKEEIGAHREEIYDQTFDMTLIKYKSPWVYFIRTLEWDKQKPIQGYITFMSCCKDKCLPPVDIDFSIPPQ